MKISDSQKRYLLIISFALVATWLIHDFINHKDNFYNLAGFIIGLVGIVFTIEDKRNTKIVKAFDDISLAIREVKTELKTEMQDRDNDHDHRLTELTTKLAFVEHKLDLHCEQFGHPEMIKELFVFQRETKNNISELSANVNLLTKQGKIDYQLDKMKSEHESLSKLVQNLIVSETG